MNGYMNRAAKVGLLRILACFIRFPFPYAIVAGLQHLQVWRATCRRFLISPLMLFHETSDFHWKSLICERFDYAIPKKGDYGKRWYESWRGFVCVFAAGWGVCTGFCSLHSMWGSYYFHTQRETYPAIELTLLRYKHSGGESWAPLATSGRTAFHIGRTIASMILSSNLFKLVGSRR